MRRSVTRIAATIALSIATLALDWMLLREAAARDVSMTLLAGGGATASATILVAGLAMILRLFVRFALPGLLAYSVTSAIMDARSAASTRRRPAS